MEKKKLYVTAATTVVVLVLLLVWRSVSLKNAADNNQLSGGVFAEAQNVAGTTYLIPHDEIYDLGVTDDAMPSLNSPSFTSVLAADSDLADELYGISIEVDGTYRFYPVQVLNWHGVVNDVVEGSRLVVTYDVLTGSAAVFEAGDRTFEISGKVYNNNTLLADQSDNLWYQIRGQMVVGDNAGATLTPYPFQMYRWVDWKADHPNGEALGFNTGFDREYRRHPHGGYETSKQIYFPLNYVATPMPIKATVDGVAINGEAAAFARSEMRADLVNHVTVGGAAIVAFYDFDRAVTNVYNASVDGRALTFTFDNDEEAFIDQETGSMWNTDGLAIDGELEGTQLETVTATEAYWFAWAAAYPNTTYPGIDPEDAPKAE